MSSGMRFWSRIQRIRGVNCICTITQTDVVAEIKFLYCNLWYLTNLLCRNLIKGHIPVKSVLTLLKATCIHLLCISFLWQRRKTLCAIQIIAPYFRYFSFRIAHPSFRHLFKFLIRPLALLGSCGGFSSESIVGHHQ